MPAAVYRGPCGGNLENTDGGRRAEASRPYELGEVAAMAAAYSRCPKAIALLTDFMANPILMNQIGQAWINALGALDSPEARRLLLSLVDPEISGIPDTVTFGRQDVVAARLAAIAARDDEVARRLLNISAMPLTGPRRDLLTKTLGMIQSTGSDLRELDPDRRFLCARRAVRTVRSKSRRHS